MKRVIIDSLDTRRLLAVTFASYFADRVLEDPVFDWVTQKRAYGDGYSSCGDLPHTILSLLGFRVIAILNRALYTHNGANTAFKYKDQANLSKLVFNPKFVWAQSYYRQTGSPLYGKPGDILFMSDPAKDASHNYSSQHVCIVKEHSTTMLHSYDFGQKGTEEPDIGKPASRERSRIITQKAGVQHLDPDGNRIVQGLLRLEDLEFEEAAYVPDDFSVECSDAGSLPDGAPDPSFGLLNL
jgi:hypothetical protein